MISNQRLYDLTNRQLQKLGFDFSLKGTENIRTAIMLYVKDRTWQQKTVSDVLNYIAEDFDSTADSIDTAFRSAIVIAFECNPRIWSAYSLEFSGISPPKTKTFLLIVSEKVKRLYERGAK